MSTLTDKVKVGGLYRHFKGGIYRVTDVVHDSEDWDKLLVVYYDVFDPANHRTARRLEMFLEEVEKEHTDPGRIGYKGPRFTYIPGSDEPVDWRLVAMRLMDAFTTAILEGKLPDTTAYGITPNEHAEMEFIFDALYDPLTHNWRSQPFGRPKSMTEQSMPRGHSGEVS